MASTNPSADSRGSIDTRHVTLSTTIVVVCLVWLVAAAATAADKYRPFTDAKWRLNQPYPETQVSPDRTSLTTRLPPASTIDNNFTGQFAGIDMEFGPGQEYHPAAGADILPSSAGVQCFYDRYSPLSLSCRADTTWLRTMDQETTVLLRVKGFGTTIRMLSWTFEPASGDVFIDRIDGSSTAEKGRPYDFTLRLTEPAPSGGLEVMWRIDPAQCFAGLRGGVAYASSGALNVVDIPAGSQYKALSVAVEPGCSSGGATIRTWVHEQVDRTPYYRTKSIRLADPPRGR